MKRALVFLLLAVFNGLFVFSQSTGSIMYVAVKTTDLNSSHGVFADNLGVLNLGDTVTLLGSTGKWAEVRVNNSLTGWVAMSSLSARLIKNSDQSVTAKEVALAGKGFSSETEVEYRKNGLDYSIVNTIETENVSKNDLKKFIQEGRLSSGEKSDDILFRIGKFFIETEKSPTIEDEYYLGRAVAVNILAAYKPYTQKRALTFYLNRICQTLVINSPRPVIFNNYHLTILDNPGYNAFATPGGHIFITKGLVEAAPSEDALAGIIAHELAHIFLRHSISIIDDMKFDMELDEEIEEMAHHAISNVNIENKRITVFRKSVNDFFDIMVKSGYTKPQEFEADRAATALLAETGYDPGGLLEMLKVLNKIQHRQKDGFNSTHPTPSERITNLEREVFQYSKNNTRSFRVSRFKQNK